MFEIKEKSAAPFYIAAACWIIYAVIFPMHRITDFLIIGGISVIAYIITAKITTKKTVMSKVDLSDTGDAKVNSAIKQGMKELYEIKSAADGISDDILRTEVKEIVATGTKIFEYLAKDTSSYRKVRTFSEYYLPTTHKLVTTYIDFQNKGDSKSVMESLKKTKDVMDTVSDAFKSQLDGLYENKALDISTDITVLERTLKEEGLK